MTLNTTRSGESRGIANGRLAATTAAVATGNGFGMQIRSHVAFLYLPVFPRLSPTSTPSLLSALAYSRQSTACFATQSVFYFGIGNRSPESPRLTLLRRISYGPSVQLHQSVTMKRYTFCTRIIEFYTRHSFVLNISLLASSSFHSIINCLNILNL